MCVFIAIYLMNLFLLNPNSVAHNNWIIATNLTPYIKLMRSYIYYFKERQTKIQWRKDSMTKRFDYERVIIAIICSEEFLQPGFDRNNCSSLAFFRQLPYLVIFWEFKPELFTRSTWENCFKFVASTREYLD